MMFDRFTYKQKNIGLVVVVVLVAFIAYKGALSKTFQLIDECKKMESEVTQADQAPLQINALTMELQSIENILGKGADPDTEFQEALLSQVSGFCDENNTVLKEFPELLIKEQQDYHVQTAAFVVEGRYEKLLKLLHELEQVNPVGKVAGAEFNARKDLKTKRLHLTATIYVQNVKKT